MKNKKYQVTQPDKYAKRFLKSSQCISAYSFWPYELEGRDIEDQPAERDYSQNHCDNAADFYLFIHCFPRMTVYDPHILPDFRL